MGEELKLGEGTLYFNGSEVKGITDFECSNEDYGKSFAKCCTIINENTIEVKCKVDFWSFIELIGLWDWVMKYCPNKRVVHLAKYGRTIRVRHKNFRRACRLLEKEILT